MGDSVEKPTDLGWLETGGESGSFKSKETKRTLMVENVGTAGNYTVWTLTEKEGGKPGDYGNLHTNDIAKVKTALHKNGRVEIDVIPGFQAAPTGVIFTVEKTN